jgi:hypothetical protein
VLGYRLDVTESGEKWKRHWDFSSKYHNYGDVSLFSTELPSDANYGIKMVIFAVDDFRRDLGTPIK